MRVEACGYVLRSLAVFLMLGSCYSLPTWSGDVAVHPVEREAIARCGTGALTADGKARITRPPYLQSTTTTSTTIVWGSEQAPRGEVILREPDGDEVSRASAERAGPALAKAVVEKLEPTHLYCYQLVADGVALTEPAPLATAAAPGMRKPIRFVALGDSGNGSAAQDAIAKRMSEVPFDFMIFLGDIAYEDGTAKQLEAYFFAVYREFLRYVPAYPSIGNHERHTRKGQPYFDAFVLPHTERYYAWDWGDVHFVAIDTTQRDARQIAWLDADLRATKQPWKIVFGHHPMYTSSVRTAGSRSIRKAFAKVLTDNKVDFYLSGHEHHYERFRVANVNHVISGGGGARLMYFWSNLKAMAQAARHHFLAFEVSATHLEMRVIDINGEEIESVKLEKASLPTEQTPIKPEKEIVPDERIHDKPDDPPHDSPPIPLTFVR
jgi:3',5'-cyclic AMP phosphodiesterase CpdA